MGDHVCPWWLAYTFDNPLRRLIHNPFKILGDYVREGMKALDIGCGMGYFSLALAELVGPTGAVIAVDVQEKMLSIMKKRAQKAGVPDVIKPHLARPDSIGLSEKVDFILAFWMAHETPDADKFFKQVAPLFKSETKLLLAEPRFHVTAGRFLEILESAQKAGLQNNMEPRIAFSRTAVFEAGGTDID